jgi:Tetratricopeptide repeat
MGRYEAAEPLYEQALSISQQVLGTDHPDTAASLNNLTALSAIPAARIKVLCNPIISSGRQPVGCLYLACRTFFGDRIASSLVKTPLSVAIKAQCPHRDKVSSHSIKPYHPGKSMVIRGRLGGINRKDGSRLLQSIKERFKQLPHGRQGIIIKQSSHPLPKLAFAPQFGPHRLEQRAAQLLDLID